MDDSQESFRPSRRINRKELSSGRPSENILAELDALEGMLKEPHHSGKAMGNSSSLERPKKRGRGRREKLDKHASPQRDQEPAGEDKEEWEPTASSYPAQRPRKENNNGKTGNFELSANEQDVLTYLNTQNRPYNFQTIYDNLHGKLKKADLQKALDTLVATKALVNKDFGRSVIYWPPQKGIEINADTLSKAAKALADAKEKLEKAKDQNRTLKTELQELERLPTTEILETRLERLNIEMPQLQLRIADYTQRTTELLDRSIVMKKQSDIEGLEKECNKRKKLLKSIIDSILESMDVPKKKLLEKIGIEI